MSSGGDGLVMGRGSQHMHKKVEERVKVILAVLYEGGMWACIHKDYSARMNMLHAMYVADTYFNGMSGRHCWQWAMAGKKLEKQQLDARLTGGSGWEQSRPQAGLGAEPHSSRRKAGYLDSLAQH